MKKLEYTIKQLADLAGVSRRTLHHYDRLGLLKPAGRGENCYRYYGEPDLLRLQQILFYRELGMVLKDIRVVLEQPDFNVMDALCSHREALAIRMSRLEELIKTVDKTIVHMSGGQEMNKKDIFKGFSREDEEKYYKEARQKYDPLLVDKSMKNWKSYSHDKQKEIIAESNGIYQDIFDNMGKGADSPEVQSAVARWHQNLRYFYEPTTAVLRGLGKMYRDSPDFRSKFEQYSSEFPEFLHQTIMIYCSRLS